MQPETRQKIVDSFMELLGETSWNDATLENLAQRAGVSLGELRATHDTRFGIVEDFVRRIDEGILAGVDPEMAGEGPRERLFDILFSRLEALNPHKPGLRNLASAARRDPGLALVLNRTVVISMSWMLTAAGIGATGPRGMVHAQALALVWGRVLRTWLHEDDPGLPKTMTDLDVQLRRSERAAERIDRLLSFVPGPRHHGSRAPDPGPLAATELAEGHPS